MLIQLSFDIITKQAVFSSSFKVYFPTFKHCYQWIHSSVKYLILKLLAANRKESSIPNRYFLFFCSQTMPQSSGECARPADAFQSGRCTRGNSIFPWRTIYHNFPKKTIATLFFNGRTI